MFLKKRLFALCFLFFCFSLYSEGINPDKVSVIKTEFFDFIYPERSKGTAELLASRADDLYKYAAGIFSIETFLHIPVVINPYTDQLNASFSAIPYNRIVVYDTLPDGTSLAVFSETIVSVFYHELIHAVTLNIKDKLTKTVSSIFGDLYSFGYLFMPLSFVEGATVSMESMKGEGRINSSEAMSFLVQAKLDNQFPDWIEAIGTRDIYPVGKYPYLVGGAFSNYLQKKYGLSKYSELWFSANKTNAFTLSGLFKEVYDISIEDAWNDFYTSIPVPNVAPEEIISSIIEKKGIYTQLSYRKSENDCGFAVIDNSENAVLYIPTVNGIPTKNKVARLFTIDDTAKSLSFSKDGNFLSISYLNNKNKYFTKIYDMTKKKFVSHMDFTLRDAVFINDTYIAGINTFSGKAEIKIYDLDSQNIKATIDFDLFDEPYALVSMNDYLLCLHKNKGKWALAFFSEKNNYTMEYDYCFPETIVPLSMSPVLENDGVNKLALSVTVKEIASKTQMFSGALPKLALLSIVKDNKKVECNLSIQETDVSGGVFSPVYYDNKYAFISKKTDHCRLSSFTNDVPGGFSEPIVLKLLDRKNLFENELTSESILASKGFKSEKYNAFTYFKKGTFFPFFSHFSLVGKADRQMSYPIVGGAFLTSSPKGDISFSLGGGWTPFVNTFSGTASFILGNEESGVNLYSDGTWSLSNIEEYNAGIYAYGTKSLFSGCSSIEYTNDLVFSGNIEDSNYFTNTSYIGFSHNIKRGLSTYANTGFSTAITMLCEYKNVKWIFNPGFTVAFGLARLLPFENPDSLTFNLPFSFATSFISSNEDFLNAKCKIVLFSKEIQHSIPIIKFYAQRFNVYAGGSVSYKTDLDSWSIIHIPTLISGINQMKTKVGLTGGAALTVSPVIGMMSSIKLNIGCDFTWYFVNTQNEKQYEINICGLFTL